MILACVLKYPKGDFFYFEGFNGVADQHQLVSHIIDCAKKIDGTQLVPDCYNKTPSQKSKSIIITLILLIDYISI